MANNRELPPQKKRSTTEERTGIRAGIYYIAAGLLATMLGISGTVMEHVHSKKTERAKQNNTKSIDDDKVEELETSYPQAKQMLDRELNTGVDPKTAAERVAKALEMFRADSMANLSPREKQNRTLLDLGEACRDKFQQLAEREGLTMFYKYWGNPDSLEETYKEKHIYEMITDKGQTNKQPFSNFSEESQNELRSLPRLVVDSDLGNENLVIYYGGRGVTKPIYLNIYIPRGGEPENPDGLNIRTGRSSLNADTDSNEPLLTADELDKINPDEIAEDVVNFFEKKLHKR